MVLEYTRLQVVYTPQMNQMLRSLTGDGWRAGLVCTPGSGMSVSITTGSGFHDGVSWSTNQTAITVCAANATFNRRDTVFWSKSLAALTHITGSATVLPKPMVLPASQIPVHEIYVSYADTQIGTGNITDLRLPTLYGSQIFMVDGSRGMTGDLSMGSSDILMGTGKIKHSEIGFRESKCPRCGQIFEVGDRLGLMVTYRYEGQDSKNKHILARPVHITCNYDLAGKNKSELMKLLKDELLDYTAVHSIDTTYMMTKEEIVEKIKGA